MGVSFQPLLVSVPAISSPYLASFLSLRPSIANSRFLSPKKENEERLVGKYIFMSFQPSERMGRSSFIYYRIGAVHATSGPFKARECRFFLRFSSYERYKGACWSLKASLSILILQSLSISFHLKSPDSIEPAVAVSF